MNKTFEVYIAMSEEQLQKEYAKIKKAKEKYETKNGPLGCPGYGIGNLLTACANKGIDIRKWRLT